MVQPKLSDHLLPSQEQRYSCYCSSEQCPDGCGHRHRDGAPERDPPGAHPCRGSAGASSECAERGKANQRHTGNNESKPSWSRQHNLEQRQDCADGERSCRCKCRLQRTSSELVEEAEFVTGMSATAS